MPNQASDAQNSIPGGGASTTAATETVHAAPRTGPAPSGAPRGGSRFKLHPLWLAVGVAVLFGLVFGAGRLSGTASASSANSVQATTISVIQNVSPSVVQIQGRGPRGAGGIGSGEILTTSGYIVTNDHVVRGLTNLTVLLSNNQRYTAQLIGEAPTEDLAVIKITASNLKPISVGDSSQAQVGQSSIALGSPLGLEQSATSGIVSALNRNVDEEVDGQQVTITGLIQTSAAINPGNSGGALVNLQGQLIGIPTLAALIPSSGAPAPGIGFAISSNRMESVVQQLTNGAA